MFSERPDFRIHPKFNLTPKLDRDSALRSETIGTYRAKFGLIAKTQFPQSEIQNSNQTQEMSFEIFPQLWVNIFHEFSNS
jgi:hypothetical protein